MKIAFNILPLKSAHRLRGIGYYTAKLLEKLKTDESIEVFEFTNINEVKDVDLIHYPWFDFYFHTLPIRRRVKTVVTIHDAIPLIFPKHYPPGFKGRINHTWQKLALKSVRAVITDSQTSKEDLVEYLKLRKDSIFPIHLAADDDFKVLPDSELLKIRRKFNLPDKFILYVGDVNWVKNLPFLVKGFAKLRRNPMFGHIKLILIGGVFLKKVENYYHVELDSIKRVNALITNLNLENEVIRPGRIEKKDLVAFYNLASLYVHPSLYEGFGLPVLEALSCGVPVVCSKTGSLQEVAGDAAIYFNPKDDSQFLNVLEEVLINDSLQKKLSSLSLKQAEKFSWDKVKKETVGVYEKVLNA